MNKSFTQLSTRLLQLGALTVTVAGMAIGCARSKPGMSLVQIQTPNDSVSSPGSLVNRLSTYPTSSKGQLCYAINVLGSGIPESSSSCGFKKGAATNFVRAGDALSLQVLKGSGRTIEVYLHVGLQDGSCPTGDLDCSALEACSLFKVGSKTGVDTNSDADVKMSVDFPGWDQSIGDKSTSRLCLGKLRGALDSSGAITDGIGNPVASLPPLIAPISAGDPPVPLAEWFYLDSNLPGIITSSGNSSEDSGWEFPPHVRSITRKPDTKKFFGLIGNGTVVEVFPSSNTTKEFDEVNCPFATCEVPPWIQTISAGYGQSLFGLDHAGRIHKIFPTKQLLIMDGNNDTHVAPNVTQVSYF